MNVTKHRYLETSADVSSHLQSTRRDGSGLINRVAHPRRVDLLTC